MIETDQQGRIEEDLAIPEPFTEDAEAAYKKDWFDSFKPVKKKKRAKTSATKPITRAKSGQPTPVRSSSRTSPSST